MKNYIYYLLLLCSLGTVAQTGTANNAKYKMQTPVMGSASDSIVVWNGADKFLKWIPKSALSVGGNYVPLTGTVDPITGDLNSTANFYTENGQFGAFSGIESATLGYNFLQIINQGTGEEIIIYSDRIQTTSPTSFVVTERADNVAANYEVQKPNLPEAIYTPVFSVGGVYADANGDVPSGGGGSGTVTEVTGTDGVTVANGTTTPVIGLGDITPDSILIPKTDYPSGVLGSLDFGGFIGDVYNDKNGTYLVVDDDEQTVRMKAAGGIFIMGQLVANNLSGTNTGDNATNTTSNTYADSKVVNTITNGDTTHAPNGDVVFDALALKAPLASPTFTGTVAGITKSMVGLGNVDNTSDASKPISTATQTSLDTKAPKKSFIALASDYTLTSTISAQKIFNVGTSGNGAFQLQANKLYRFTGLISISALAAVSQTVMIGFGGTANITDFKEWVTGKRAVNSPGAASATFVNTIASTSVSGGSTSTTAALVLEGTLRVTTAGTFIPQISLGTAAASVITSGSSFLIEEIGSDTSTHSTDVD